MERLAVIADLHANRYALEAFLQYIKDHEPVSWILNLGDFAQIGPHPEEVAEVVLSDPRFLNIAGNNELTLLERCPAISARRGAVGPDGIAPNSAAPCGAVGPDGVAPNSAAPCGAVGPDGVAPNSAAPEEAAHQDWTIDRLGTDLLGRMAGLPQERVLRLAGRRLLLLHAPPKGLASRPLRSWPAGLARIGRSPEVDSLFFGHSHRQACASWGGRLILNPGSLGCSLDGRGTFCLVEIGRDRVQLAVHEVTYDRTCLRDDYERLDVPDRRALLRGFHGLSI